MDDVPVKIVERYKPPPLIYHLPQAIANKLTQDANHYYEHPQYQYDFELERNTLASVQYWRQVRQNEYAQRQVRREHRKQEQQRALEAQQKEMLGAVQYPSTEELSSSSSMESDADVENESDKAIIASCDKNKRQISELTTKTTKICNAKNEPMGVTVPEKSITARQKQISTFHNILQPIVLKQQVVESQSSAAISNQIINENKKFAKDTFNYADFESGNDSPFDSIELKTINDLDILAQVLHYTQVKDKGAENVQNAEETKILMDTKIVNGIEVNSEQQESVNDLKALNETKAVLEKIDFNQCNDNDDAKNIPSQQCEQINLSHNFNLYPPIYSTNKTTTTTTTITALSSTQQLQHHTTNTTQSYHMMQLPPSLTVVTDVAHCQQYQQQALPNYTAAYNKNQNYLLINYCNGSDGLSMHYNNTAFGTPTHKTTSATAAAANEVPAHDTVIKSKSVPDILRELKTELLKSEMNCSSNLSHKVHSHEVAKTAHTISRSIYTELTGPARKLADRISSMGFPLERVAKVVHMCGSDDKKIIEHLIPLSELMDLGFDETKVSAALLKFDNNKDKALDYLIS